MDGVKVDRRAQAFAKTTSRRQLAPLIGALLSMLVQSVARGSQLGRTTCRRMGRVCSLHSGCCRGLTCVTAATNMRYGICVPGTGRMVAIAARITPFRETAVDEVTPQGQASSAEPTTSRKAEREAHSAEIMASGDTKSTKKKTRLDTKRTRIKTRKEEKKTLPPEAGDAAKSTLGPHLEFELLNPGGLTGTETLTVRNLGTASVFLVRIESVLQPEDNSATNRTVSPAGSFSYYSGIPDEISDDNELAWIKQLICSETAGAGFRVTVGANADSVNQQYVVLCDGPSVVRVNEPSQVAPDHKRKRHHHRHHKKKR
jgi:hypothetical protein